MRRPLEVAIGSTFVLRRPPGPSRLLPAAAVALFTVALLVVAARPASGHAALVSSQPEPGAELSSAPGVVTLRFSEPLIADLSYATVIAPTGEEFTGAPVRDDVILVELTSSGQGEYTVDWKTVSPLDGHTLRGSFQFGVGTSVGPAAIPSGAPARGDLLVATGRTVEYLGLLGALGWLSLAALARQVGSGWAPTGLLRWVVLAAGGGLVTVAGELLLASGGAAGPAIRAFVLASSGPPRLVRLVAELLAVAVVARAAVRRTGDAALSSRAPRTWAALLVLTALVGLSAAGHAAASGPGAILLNAGHLVGAGLWAGTIVVGAVHRPPDGWSGETGRRLLTAFAPLALAAFAVTVLLGAARGAQELARVGDLWQTGYGLTLTVKAALVALMVPLSVRVWRRGAPLARGEALLAVAVVAVAAVLAAYPVTPSRSEAEPARAADAETAEGLPRQGDLTLAGDAGSTVVGISVRPGEPGPNDVDLYLVPRGGPEDAGDLEVTLATEDSGPAGVRRCGVACRTATVSLDGGERLEVEVSGEDGGTATVELPALPAPDGTELLQAVDQRMDELDSFAYDEVFGPHEPPTLSTWRAVVPDRLHGVITRGDDEYRETIRIGDRRWNRDGPDADWEGGEPGGLTVTANRFIWDQEARVAARIVDTDAVDGVETRVVSFYVEVSGLPIWYRLWVDDDHLVRRAEMRAQGHFMDHRYHRFDEALEVEPPA